MLRLYGYADSSNGYKVRLALAQWMRHCPEGAHCAKSR